MFGVMDLKTGRCWENNGDIEPYFKKQFLHINDNNVAVPKDYINWWTSGHKCERGGCFKDGSVECYVPGDECEFLNRDEKFIIAQCGHPSRSVFGNQPCEDEQEPWNCEYYKRHNMVEYFCCDHAFKAGYCIICGEFWSGIEDFDFGNGLCDNCKDAIDCEQDGSLDDEEIIDAWI